MSEAEETQREVVRDVKDDILHHLSEAEETQRRLDALRQDDTYHPPRRPRPRIKPKWRVEYPDEFPVTVTRRGASS